MYSIIERFIYKGIDYTPIYTKCWKVKEPKGIIQIIHGLGENSDYYSELAKNATGQGYNVYINEARGHGDTGGKDHAGDTGKNGFYYLIEDIHFLTKIINKNHPNIPIYLIGHSLGATLAQLYVEKYGEYISGVTLTGLPRILNTQELLDVVQEEIIENGEEAPSQKTFEKIFANINDQFKYAQTEIDWITSDTDKVEKILKSRYSNVLFNNRFYKDFISTLIETQKPGYFENFPKEISTLLLAGSDDVLNGNGAETKEEYKRLKNSGVKNIQYKIYNQMRHSILQEKNRKVVENDILDWIELIQVKNNGDSRNEAQVGVV